MKLGHIALSVSNLRRSIDFYRRYLGVRCVKTYSYADRGLTIALLKNGDIALELFEFKKYKPLPRYRRTLKQDLQTLGVKHFAVEVPNILRVFNKFKKAKAIFATDLCVFGNGARYFFIQDHDGILIEFIEKIGD